MKMKKTVSIVLVVVGIFLMAIHLKTWGIVIGLIGAYSWGEISRNG
jgi:uncharacterized membrane protein